MLRLWIPGEGAALGTNINTFAIHVEPLPKRIRAKCVACRAKATQVQCLYEYGRQTGDALHLCDTCADAGRRAMWTLTMVRDER